MIQAIEIYIGDQDVLIGGVAIKGAVQVWFAPLPADHGLPFNQTVPANNATAPGNEVVNLFFVNREALNGFIDLLNKTRDRAFPEKT